MTFRNRVLSIAATTVAVLVAGAGLTAPDRPAVATVTPTASYVGSAPPRRIVVVISVDGLGAGVLSQLAPAQIPAFSRMRRWGASTLDARSAVERTRTLPNHTSMMTGRSVFGVKGHRVGINKDDGGTLAGRAGYYIPGIFDAAHDGGLRTGLFTSKRKFRYLRRSWDAEHGAPDVVGADDGRDKISRFLQSDPATLVRRLNSRLRTDPLDLTFLHVELPDDAGHRHGWLTTPYLDAVRRTDTLLGRILDTITYDEALRRRTVVVLTADHGGPGGSRDHEDSWRYANYRVPFLVWGAGVQPGAGLYRLNPSRVWPGLKQPSYAASARPVRVLDVARLATALLGLPPLRGADQMGTSPLRLSD